jgi:glucose/arabinose dehydrogenase
VTGGLTSPVDLQNAGDGRLFIVEQSGVIRILDDTGLRDEPFLDIRDRVDDGGNEQGLLGLAFHPDFAANGLFYVNYTDGDGDTVIARYRVGDDPNRADAAGEVVVLTFDQPYPNHNGGGMAFGPDGDLYIGTGDGGSQGDPQERAQNPDSLLGKILRLDVDAADPYASPPDNVFASGGGRPEVWALGLRNPWRFAFDRASGDLFIADVGQNAQEEVHFQPAASRGGENYGWNTMEGDACFRAPSCDQSGLELPVAVYPHDGPAGGCSITGGYVYRGAQFPQLAGTYLYADYCSGNLWALWRAGDAWQSGLVGQVAIRTSSFGEDDAGELYLTDRDGGGLYRLVVE